MGSSTPPPNKSPHNNIHVFMVSFPAQGHVNPLLRLGRRLADFGLFITFCAPEAAGASIRKSNCIVDDEPAPLGRGMIRFEFFNDGWDSDTHGNLNAYMNHLELVGREKLPQMIRRQGEMGRPVSCLINNPFIPWVSDVAESLKIPSAMLWVQSCACFSAYYHYYNKLAPFPSEEEPEIDVQLPNLPLLKHDEAPSFLHPRTPYPFLAEAILTQFRYLSKPFCILMDTFQELEHDIVEYMSKISRPIRTIGPLFSETGSKSNAIRADFFEAESCVEWLDTKPPRTVVYISVGSVVQLQQEQVDEIAGGLAAAGVSFLWVMRPPAEIGSKGPCVLPEGFLEEVGDKGKIVRWSPQEKVLAHPSTACFVTHCGWNSSMEAVACGVPVVALPQWGDQVTNAKFLVDVYKVGIRMSRGEAEGKIVPRDEVAATLRAATAGPTAEEIRENVIKWKKVAEEAVSEGGSSYNNMLNFVEEAVRISTSVTIP